MELFFAKGNPETILDPTNFELVGGIPTPLKNMRSSVGIMTFPIYGKGKNVPNHHQSEIINHY